MMCYGATKAAHKYLQRKEHRAYTEDSNSETSIL